MAAVSEQRLFGALATVTRAFAEGGVPTMPGRDVAAGGTADDPSPAVGAMDDEAREVRGEAALAVAFGAFASRGGDSGPIHTLIAAMGLMAIPAEEEPDPPAEILGILAQDGQVEAEIDRAGAEVDRTFGREATAEDITAALEARILGTAIILAGCPFPERVDGQVAVRLRGPLPHQTRFRTDGYECHGLGSAWGRGGRADRRGLTAPVSPGPAAPRRTALGVSLAALTTTVAAGQTGAAGHVVLLGDSIFDNEGYVAGGPDVIAHLRNRLPAGWRATLVAANGAVTADVIRQLERAPREASHFVVSIGGNDALGQEGVLSEPARSVGEGLTRLAGVVARFRQDYRAMLDAVLARRLPTALCTVYDPRFPDPQRQRQAVAGLTLFNDAITREAFLRGLPVIDLRLVCNEDADFASAIEPSVQGGHKIAVAIARFATEQGARQGRSMIYGSD